MATFNPKVGQTKLGELYQNPDQFFQREKAQKLASIGITGEQAKRIALFDTTQRSGISYDNPAIIEAARSAGYLDDATFQQKLTQTMPTFTPGSKGGSPSPYDFKGGDPDFNLAPGPTETITRTGGQTQTTQAPQFSLTGG